MTTGPQNQSAKTWKPVTAGILSIVAGTFAIAVGLWAFKMHEYIGRENRWHFWALVSILLGIVAITGGIFALRRRLWGLALAGAICALFPWHVFVLGILAIIFVALSKGEFDKPAVKDKIIVDANKEPKPPVT